MDTSQLETFLAIIEHKNYSKAAEFLNVTQPTVTARIKNLENELNCKLFDRAGKNVTLSPEGEVFVEYATSILTYMNHSKEATNSSKFPNIKIGVSPGFSYSFITNLIRSILSIDNLSITIIEGENSVRLNEQILSGELDVVFTRNAVSHNPNIVSEFLFDDKIVLICGKTHRLAQKNKLTLHDLQDETVIWFRRNTPLLSPVEKQLIGIPNIKHVEVGNNEMLKKVVGSGLGIGITLLLGVDEVDKDKIIVKNVEELDDIPNKVYVQSRKQLLTDNPIKKIIYSIINDEIIR
ncbi:LysR family transcriptional regulator [Bacillus sp. V3B]|uniref:LysR family transcriptional regulator n=1 Tax=Bacillus sp. V3B TaxID=2804915 RepID=UPI00210E1230|nr:LysR family transcriptional regulator [Bacillus sp. V3B]MCQ6274931.1 LysR family transcriptional regulator [Bacillus sp. V3B]